MKVILIEPNRPDPTVYDLTKLPRLGLPLLGQLLVERGHEVRIYVESLSPVDWNDVAKADLVGFSTITCTAPATYEMAARVRSMGIPTVIGGPHVSFLPDEALDCCDFVVRGEGQETLIELADALEDNTGLNIAGLSYRDPDGNPIHNPNRPSCTQKEFAALPAPNLKLIVGWQNMTQAPIMTSWGCPHDCDFCSVVPMFGRKVRFRPVEDILDDLEKLGNQSLIFFYDDNFVVNKNRTKALLRGMITRGLKLRWSAQMRASAVFRNEKSGETDHELMELMRRSGCQGVYCGFESVSQTALDMYNKHQKIQDISGAMRTFHKYGIHVHGMFIFGGDADDAETFRETVDFTLQHKIGTVQFIMLIPLPGTRIYQRMIEQDRLLTKDWSLYDGHYCVILPKLMSPYELQTRTHWAMLRFYSSKRSIMMILRNLPRFVWREQKLLQQLLIRQLYSYRDVLDAMAELTKESKKTLKEIMRLPALRLYALKQCRKWTQQARAQQYLHKLLYVVPT